MIRIGSLFTGYGGLELGIAAVLGGTTAWVSDIDSGACKILAHRYPDVPNLGDITTVNWADVEPVDIITGGFPCQDVSHAGARRGLGPGTRSGLWSRMADAIDHLRPSLVIAENVRGLLSAEADSDVEPCPWCLGDRPGEPPLRALGSVLADLAELGYDAGWYGLRAADVGAPHGRFRVFVLAWPTGGVPADAARGGMPAEREGHLRAAAADPTGARCAEGEDGGSGRGDAGAGAWSGEPERGDRELGAPADADRTATARLADASERVANGRVAAGGDRPGDYGGGAPTDANREGSQGAQPAAGRLLPDGCAVADATGHGRDEGRPESAGLVGGSDVAVGGDAAAHAHSGERDRRERQPVRGSLGRATAAGSGAGHHGGLAASDAELDLGPQGRLAAPLGGDADGRVLPSADDLCPTCGDLVDYHDEGGFCAGLCGGTCTDPDWGRPGDQAAPDAERATGRASAGLRDGSEAAQGVGPAGVPGGCGALRDVDWGAYEPAIRRWERRLGRPAPAPTEPGSKGQQRLSPAFVEWMMGLPAGWVTEVPGLSRNDQLKALGNGVVPQQAAAAIAFLITHAGKPLTDATALRGDKVTSRVKPARETATEGDGDDLFAEWAS